MAMQSMKSCLSKFGTIHHYGSYTVLKLIVTGTKGVEGLCKSQVACDLGMTLECMWSGHETRMHMVWA